MIQMPGWNSIDITARIHDFCELWGIVLFLIVVVLEFGAYFYGHRHDSLVGEAARVANIRRDQHEQDLQAQHEAEVARIHGQLSAAQKKLSHLSASRVLTEVQLRKITDSLDKYPFTGAVVILPVWGKQEIVSFAAQLAGVIPKRTNNGAGALLLRPPNITGYPDGIILKYGTMNELAENFAKEFARLLNADGIAASAIGNAQPANDPNIFISISEIP